MKKPNEIIALEKVHNIKLNQVFDKVDIVTGEHTNLFLTDKKNKVIGLNLSNNNIESIKGFENFKELLYLNLYGNSLSVTDFLQAFSKLEILIIGNNKIVKLNEFSNPDLKILNLFK
nr:leucine-rich repeat domain-containing protein [uncultured Chryseobacterium sp.]